MKKAITSMEELYGRSSPIGEIVVDAVVEALRGTRILRVNELAGYMEVDKRELRSAWHLVTGIALSDAIRQWRKLQAREMLADAGYPWQDDDGWCKTPVTVLERVARACGWKSALVLKHVMGSPPRSPLRGDDWWGKEHLSVQ